MVLNKTCGTCSCMESKANLAAAGMVTPTQQTSTGTPVHYSGDILYVYKSEQTKSPG